MKINWGHKILFVYIAFVLGIMFLVFKANGERYDMVNDNYYEETLRYQEVIDQKERVKALSAEPVVQHTDRTLTIQFPPELKGKQLKGECHLYRPSDERKDIRKEFTTEDGALQWIFEQPVKGLYDLKLYWEMEGLPYFFERKIIF